RSVGAATPPAETAPTPWAWTHHRTPPPATARAASVPMSNSRFMPSPCSQQSPGPPRHYFGKPGRASPGFRSARLRKQGELRAFARVGSVTYPSAEPVASPGDAPLMSTAVSPSHQLLQDTASASPLQPSVSLRLLVLVGLYAIPVFASLVATIDWDT